MAKNFLEQITIEAVAKGFDGVNQKIQGLQKNAENLSKKLESVGNTLTLSVTAPLVAFAGLAIKEFAQAEKAVAKVENALKLAGKGVGLTFDELQKASENLSKNSIFGDDDILEKVSSQLLRVSGLTKDTFLEAQQVITDLASALDTDLQSATMTVAKALESPAEAIGSLGRIGIKFTEDEKKLIDALVKTGQTAEAQSIILDKLKGKFDGVALAVSNTAFGSLVKLKNSFANLAEVIGGRLFNMLEPMIEKLTNIFQSLQKTSPEVLDFAIKVGALASALGPASIALAAFLANITLILNPITLGVGAIVAITSALDKLAEKFEFVSRILSAFNTITFALVTTFNSLALALTAVPRILLEIGSATEKITGKSLGLENLRDSLSNVQKDIIENIKTTASITSNEFKNIFKGEKRDVISPNDLFSNVNKFFDDAKKLGETTGQKFSEGVKIGAVSEEYDINAALKARDEMDDEINRVKLNAMKLTETGEIFSNSFTNAFSDIASGAKSLGDSFKDLGRSIVNSLFNAAIQGAFTKLFQNLGGIFTVGGVAQGAPNLTGHAEGGYISGAGTGTSDSILSRLSNGEYVINAASTKLFRPVLDYINNTKKGFFPKSRFGMPAFAGGGEVSGNSGVTVNVINNSSQPVNARANTRFDGRQIIIDTFLEDARVNGPMSQSIQNVYGVRR